MTSETQSKIEQEKRGYSHLLLFFFPIVISVLIVLWYKIWEAKFYHQLLFVSFITVVSFGCTVWLIPHVAEKVLKRGIQGMDINKPREGASPVPESLGIVCGVVYTTCIFMILPLFSGDEMLREYSAAISSIIFMLLLGFMDDVLDLRWSVKISLSFLATLPVLIAYSGPTTIVLPKFVIPYIEPFIQTYIEPVIQMIFGLQQKVIYHSSYIELGLLYHVYMSFISVFATNSINIYAGINGLEVGQSIIIGLSVLAYNVIQLVYFPASTHQTIALLSIYLILPFLSTSLGLFYFNRYPSRVFVGDSYTYFAGITLGVVGTLGHFSKTLLLFFIPQLINFILSIPQLIGIYPCPRHRLPRYNPQTRLLEHEFATKHNMVNLTLYLIGPTSEKNLCNILLVFQVLCSLLAFAIRFPIANQLIYP